MKLIIQIIGDCGYKPLNILDISDNPNARVFCFCAPNVKRCIEFWVFQYENLTNIYLLYKLEKCVRNDLLGDKQMKGTDGDRNV